MVRFFVENGMLRCAFAGSLNTLKCLEMEKELYGRIGSDKLPVVFDLADVDFVASAFLRICLSVFKETGERLTLANVHPDVLKVFKIAGLADLIRGIA